MSKQKPAKQPSKDQATRPVQSPATATTTAYLDLSVRQRQIIDAARQLHPNVIPTAGAVATILGDASKANRNRVQQVISALRKKGAWPPSGEGDASVRTEDTNKTVRTGDTGKKVSDFRYEEPLVFDKNGQFTSCHQIKTITPAAAKEILDKTSDRDDFLAADIGPIRTPAPTIDEGKLRSYAMTLAQIDRHLGELDPIIRRFVITYIVARYEVVL